MLLLDIPRILAEKGIANPKKFLIGLGFYPQAATAILRGKRVRIDRDQIEKMCVALHCTPNELFSWQPGDATVEAGHPMRALIREKQPPITDLLLGLSPEKLEAVRALILQDGAAAKSPAQ